MTWRFRRTLKLGRGVRLNLSKRGVSLSLGGRGAQLTVGTHGARVTVGLPGTGLRYTKKLGRPSQATGRKTRAAQEVTWPEDATLALAPDEESVQVLDGQGRRLPPAVESACLKARRDDVLAWLEGVVDEQLEALEALGALHRHLLPDMSVAPGFEARQAPTLALPDAPKEPERSLLSQAASWLWSSEEDEVDQTHAAALRQHQEQVNRLTRAHDAALTQWREDESLRRYVFDTGRFENPDLLERHFADALDQIPWPLETLVSFEAPTLDTLHIAVELPDLDTLPKARPALRRRPPGVRQAAMSQTDRRRMAMTHVHSVGFVLMALAFWQLPTISRLTLNVSTERIDPRTAHTEEMTLYALRASREAWSRINLKRLDELDVVACFELFELRRKMSKTGIFKPVEPFDQPIPSSRTSSEV